LRFAHNITAFNLLGYAVFIYKNPEGTKNDLNCFNLKAPSSQKKSVPLKWHLHQNEKNLSIAAQSAQITRLSNNLEEQIKDLELVNKN
jgi:hypothetical protein